MGGDERTNGVRGPLPETGRGFFLSIENERTRAIRSGRALVVGVGALGCAAAATLVRGGVGTIGLADPDSVEISNLHRQLLHTLADLGRTKVESAARKLATEESGPVVCAHPIAVDDESLPTLFPLYDFVIDATDDPETKFRLGDGALRHDRPLSHAGAVGLEGQTFTILPRRSACLRCVFPEPPDPEDRISCREAGILGPIASILGTLQGHEAIRHLSGEGALLADRLVSFDARSLRMREVSLARDPDCAACARGSPRLSARPHPSELC